MTSLRRAVPGDIPEILAMVRELAEYERAADHVVSSEAQFAAALFSDSPSVFAHVAELDGKLVGFALWFLNFSTWRGTHGIYIEDLFVRPAYRSRGIGKMFLEELATLCADRGYARLEWWVLDWNEPALRFYKSLQATPMSEWTVHRLDGEALRTLASSRRRS